MENWKVRKRWQRANRTFLRPPILTYSSASSSEEEESWEREEKIEATKKMLLYGKNTNDRFKARAICFTCNGSSGYGSWGETTRAGRKNQFAKDIIDNM